MSDKLMESLNHLFTMRINLRKQEIARMEREMTELKQNLEKKEKNKDLIIKMQMLRLIGEGDALEWPH